MEKWKHKINVKTWLKLKCKVNTKIKRGYILESKTQDEFKIKRGCILENKTQNRINKNIGANAWKQTKAYLIE